MSLMNFNGGSSWNYSDPNKTGYALSITGTVVKVAEVQARNFQTKQPEVWPDGNPKLNVQLTIQGQSGRELTWDFSPVSLASDAVRNAVESTIEGADGFDAVGGKFVRITTQPGTYGSGNPRPWMFEILGEGNVPYRGTQLFNAANTQQPMQQHAMQQPAMQQQQPMQPMQQSMPQPMQPMQQQPMQQQPMQPMQQQPMQQAPMQQQPMQQYAPNQTLYDEDIPF